MTSNINLNTKSHYTLLNSTLSPKEIVHFSKEHKLGAAAICDQEVMYGAYEFYKLCKQEGIKPIIGLELFDNDKSYSLFAINFNGYKRLMHHSSAVKAYKQSPIFTDDDYANLIIVDKSDSNELKKFENYYRTEDLPFHKSRYLNKRDAKAVQVMNAIRDAIVLDKSELKHEGNDYMRTPDQIEQEATALQLANLKKIVDMIDVVIDYPNKDIYKYKTPNGISPRLFLESLCKQGLIDRLGVEHVTNEYVSRVLYELEVISKQGFEDYFLITWDFIKWAKEQGIVVGPGRGSAAGSLVSYALCITDVDPIEYNLLFERFLNPERLSMPDIDVDIEDENRERVIDYVYKKYGGTHVAHITTFSTLKIKMALRDVGRALGIPLRDVDGISKSIRNPSDTVEQALKADPVLRLRQVDFPELFDICSVILDSPRQVGTHAAGIVLGNDELETRVPLQSGINGLSMTQYSMDHLEELGLLKMDFLGLRNLTIIKEILSKIEKHKGVAIHPKDIPMDDEKTFKLLQSASTSGIFQLESPGMRNVLKRMRPTELEDIVATSSLFRPGPQDNIPTYIERKHGREVVSYLHPDVEKYVKSTYGIIVYQEQVMQIAQEVAGFSLGRADILRRAMGKKDMDKMESLKIDFIAQAQTRGYEKAKAEEIYEYIYRFAQYGFNRSHAVAYSIIGYWLSYLKANFPLEFMASLLSSVVGSEAKIKEYIMESKKYGIKLLQPSINNSFHKFAIQGDCLRYPLLAIRNVGQAAFLKLVRERMNEPFTEYFSTVARLSHASANKKTIEFLIWSGAFDELGVNRTSAFKNLEQALNYKDMISTTKQQSLDFGIIDKPNFIVYPIDEQMEQEKELEALGFNLKYDAMSTLKEELRTHNVNFSDISEVLKDPTPKKRFEVFCHIDKLRTITTKKGTPMAFVSISDDTGSSEGVIFSGNYDNVIPHIKVKDVHLLGVSINTNGGIIINKVFTKEDHNV